MTDVGNQQRHCASCDRVLTDFSKMSDDELLIFFKQQHGEICGRFSKTQLNRPLHLIPDEKRTSHWWKAAALIPLALFAGKAKAQSVVQGTVRDKLTQEAIPFANVIIYAEGEKDAIAVGATDFDGHYNVTLPAGAEKVQLTLRVQYVGYTPVPVQLPKVHNGQITTFDQNIELESPDTGMVVVTVDNGDMTGKHSFWSKLRGTLVLK